MGSLMNGDKTAVLMMRENPNCTPDPHKMKELRGLAEAAGYSVLAEIAQRRGRDHRYQVGRGKIDEAMGYNPDKLIFYNPLSPGQVVTLRGEFPVNVIDRFDLILEIFATRATTKEAKMQVELAKLTYDAPHVKRSLSTRKLGEQPGFGGAGAYEDFAYRDIMGRIAKIKDALKDVEATGVDRRQRRRELGFDLVALAGYTNAGKSTLLNVLTGAMVQVEDRPFTTLSPTTRAAKIGKRKILLTDTVGFIDDLPHFLIKAFRSTLSEISQADLVLLVADLSDPPDLLRRKMAASHKALWDCNSSAPIVTILNKADRLSQEEAEERMEFVKDLASSPVIVSASSGQGLEELMDRIIGRLSPMKEFQIRLPYSGKGLSQLSKLYQAGEMLDVKYEEEVVVKLRGRAKDIAQISMARE